MKPYIEMYRRWIVVPGVQAADIAVLSALYAHADRDGLCTATQGELAEELGQSRSWINAVLKALQAPEIALVSAGTHRGFRGFRYELVGAADTTCRPADSSGSSTDSSLRSENPESSFSSGMRGMEALPIDWQPDADDTAWAKAQRPDVDAVVVTGKFIVWCRKAYRRNGYSPADPSAAWRRWIARELVVPATEATTEAVADPSQSSPPSHPSSLPSRRDFRHERRIHRPSARPSAGPVTFSPAASSVGSPIGNPIGDRGSDRDGTVLAARNQDTLAALRRRLAGSA